VNEVQTLPGADIDSGHNLLVAKICTRLKKIIRFHKRKPRWDLDKLYVNDRKCTIAYKINLVNQM
jgi:hypothetical protein